MKDIICKLTGHQTLFAHESPLYGYHCWCEIWSADRRFYRVRYAGEGLWRRMREHI